METQDSRLSQDAAVSEALILDLDGRNAARQSAVIERESYCKAVLLKEMPKGNLDTAPIWNDFKTFDGKGRRGVVDIFAAGIPCLLHSLAGRRAGNTDGRDLRPDMARITREMEPRFVLLENVSGLFTSRTETIIDPATNAPEIRYVSNRLPAYGLQIIGELQAMGYFVFKFNLSAESVGANHRRERNIHPRD